MTDLPGNEEDWADFIYEVSNYTDAEEKAAIVFPLVESLRAQLASARKALDLAEYVSRKDSLTDHERLESVRTVICRALEEIA